MVETAPGVAHLSEVDLRDWGHGERYAARLGRVGSLIGAEALGCQYHVVPPGKAAFPYHAHHANEEMLVILSGEGRYRVGAATHDVRAGHVCAAPAGGPETAHQLLNTGTDELRYLCISTRNDPDVVEYPENGKTLVASRTPRGKGLMSSSVFHMFRSGDVSLDYWEGEP